MMTMIVMAARVSCLVFISLVDWVHCRLEGTALGPQRIQVGFKPRHSLGRVLPVTFTWIAPHRHL